MYMANYRCHVTGSSSNKKLATAKAPVYCKDDQSKCVKGAKQMVAWNRKFSSLDLNLETATNLTFLLQRPKETMSRSPTALRPCTTASWALPLVLRMISSSKSECKYIAMQRMIMMKDLSLPFQSVQCIYDDDVSLWSLCMLQLSIGPFLS